MKKQRLTNAGQQSVPPRHHTISEIQLNSEMLEHITPHILKPRRLRNIVRRTVRKSKTKEFTDQLDSLLGAVNQIHNLTQQLSAVNPSLYDGQRSGAIARARNNAIAHLEDTWRGMLALV